MPVSRSRRSTAAALLAAVLLAATACSYAIVPPHVVEGREFPADAVAGISVGMSADAARRVLGPPLEVQPAADGERWRYFMRTEEGDRVRLLGVIPLPSETTSTTTAVTLTIRDGEVAGIAREPT